MMDIGCLKCWFNGEIVELKDVHISLLDFGFIHSDATYDVMRSHGKKILNFELHKQRFDSSCEYFNFKTIKKLKSIGENLLEINAIQEGFVWVCVWRGTPESGNPRDLKAPQNSVVYVKPYYGLKTSNQGLRLAIIEDFRRVPSVCYSQKSKNFGWIEFNLAQRKALALGFDSALLLNPNGDITEGPGFGICFYDGSKIVTPADDCLDSVTLKIVADICKVRGVPFVRRKIEKNELSLFKAAFACSTSGGVTAVECIDNKTFDLKRSIDLPAFFDSHLSELSMK